jgi:hypothetical protein
MEEEEKILNSKKEGQRKKKELDQLYDVRFYGIYVYIVTNFQLARLPISEESTHFSMTCF